MASSRPPKPITSHLTLWLGRLLLASLWLWGAEILFWNAPTIRTLPEWVLMGAGYVLVATIALDWVVRYRVRDIWGLLLILGAFGVLNGIFINPTTIFKDVPRTILSYGLGGQWFIGLEMFGLWMFFQSWRGVLRWQRLRWAVMVAIIMGFYWGVWVRWFAVFNPVDYTPPDFEGLLMIGAVGLLPALIIGMAWRMTLGQTPALQASDYRLTERDYALVGAGGLALMLVHLITGAYSNIVGVLVSAVILGVFWTVLWVRDNTRKPSLLIEIHPPRPAPFILLLILAALMLGATWLGWHLPLVNLPLDISQFSLLTTVFGGIGAFWMPITAGVIGVQTFSRQMQTGKV